MPQIVTLIFICLLSSLASASAQSEEISAKEAAEIYGKNCAACHGTRLQGANAPSLLIQKYVYGSSDEEVAVSIRDGHVEKGMPAWEAALSEDEIQGLVQFIKGKRIENDPVYQAKLDAEKQKIAIESEFESELESFRLELVAETGKIFDLALIPDGRLLVTEDQGYLRIIENGQLLPKPVQGVPKGHPQDVFKRALLGVAVHPEYDKNGWVYLVWGDAAQDDDGNQYTKVSIVRGRLQGMRWVDSETLVTLPLNTDTGRLAFDSNGYLYLTTASEAGINAPTGREPYSQEYLMGLPPQDLSSPLGKILRFNDDGSIPADNPFVENPDAVGAIWSVGHRNPQGLAFDTASGTLWSTEHGPRGGDELNLVMGGHNYGWPVISYGTRYDGITFTSEIQNEEMDQPVINWTPSIGVSDITFYPGGMFEHWKGNLLVGSLIHEELLRVVLNKGQVKARESLLKDIGRIRAIEPALDGSVYLALELKTKTLIVRMVSAEK